MESTQPSPVTPKKDLLADLPEEVRAIIWNLCNAACKLTAARAYKKITETIYDLNGLPDQKAVALTSSFEAAIENCVALFGTKIKFNEDVGTGFKQVS